MPSNALGATSVLVVVFLISVLVVMSITLSEVVKLRQQRSLPDSPQSNMLTALSLILMSDELPDEIEMSFGSGSYLRVLSSLESVTDETVTYDPSSVEEKESVHA